MIFVAIIAAATVGIFATIYHQGTTYMAANQQGPSPGETFVSAAAHLICEAHTASIVLATGVPSAGPTIHEILQLDITSAPFWPVMAVPRNSQQDVDAKVATLDALNRVLIEHDDDHQDDQYDQYDEDDSNDDQHMHAYNLAANVFLDTKARYLYLAQVEPSIRLAGEAAVRTGEKSRKSGMEVERMKRDGMSTAWKKWCDEQGFKAQ